MADLKKEKFLAPIFGLRTSPIQVIKLGDSITIRQVDLLNKEEDLFKSYGLKASCDAVIEIEYEFDSENPNEPFPGLFLNLINKIDAALLVYGDGNVGIAAVFPANKDAWSGGGILSSARPHYDERLNKDLDDEFVQYFQKFSKAYDLRPLAFDIFRRSQDRFANHDKTIDCCTTLESLFVPKGERGKKAFILNGMKIMGFVGDDVQRIDDLIELRNAVIHADREKFLKLYSGPKYTFNWFEKTFKLVRRMLFKFVENPWD